MRPGAIPCNPDPQKIFLPFLNMPFSTWVQVYPNVLYTENPQKIFLPFSNMPFSTWVQVYPTVLYTENPQTLHHILQNIKSCCTKDLQLLGTNDQAQVSQSSLILLQLHNTTSSHVFHRGLDAPARRLQAHTSIAFN
jgi:hypothetical protein